MHVFLFYCSGNQHSAASLFFFAIFAFLFAMFVFCLQGSFSVCSASFFLFFAACSLWAIIKWYSNALPYRRFFLSNASPKEQSSCFHGGGVGRLAVCFCVSVFVGVTTMISFNCDLGYIFTTVHLDVIPSSGFVKF